MLKRIAMLAVIAFSYLNAWAYEPMYVEGKKWSFRYVDKHFGDLLKQICYEVAGDTVIGGKTIKIIREWEYWVCMHMRGFMIYPKFQSLM